MDSLSDFGCFAYYFNSLVLYTGIETRYFMHYPLVNTALVFLGGGLSLLAAKLLLRTIDLHFSEVVGEEGRERLLETAPENRSCVLNLPALLQRCLPRTWWGDTLYVVLMACLVISLVRELLSFGFILYRLMRDGDVYGWGGLFVLFAVGIFMGSSLSLQTMEGVHIGCILLNATFALSYNFAVSVPLQAPPDNIWEVVTHLYNPCFLSRHILFPTVLAASKAPSQQHIVLITWAVISVLAVQLPSYLLKGVYTPIFNETTLDFAFKILILIRVPVVFCITHLQMRTLADIVIAWRYGLNLVMARRTYPLRIKAVQILLPLLIYLPTFTCAYFDLDPARAIAFSQFGFILAVSTMYFIIPFCYNFTVQQMGEEVVGRIPAWWTYSLYAACAFSLTHTILYYYLYRTPTNILLEFCICGGIFVLMALWQTIGYFSTK